MSLRPGEQIIDESTPEHVTHDVVIDGEAKHRGLVPRDYSQYPQGCYAAAPAWSVEMQTIPQSEWSARLAEMVARKSLLSDIRLSGNGGQPIPSLDQDSYGYCWFHSATSATIALRARNHEPYVRLSAFAGACIIKNYRNEGGWGAQAVDFIRDRGVPSVEFWPEKSTQRSNDNANTWANAAKHKITAGFIDLAAAQYDRQLTFEQLATCLLNRIPVVVDFNWWSHSVCALDLVEVEKGSFGIRIWNSWTDSWSDRGMGVLQGSKAHPDAAVAPYATLPSVV